ncbi:hypothetical protein F4859DRAFT_466007 [Xylaria cf. heliscus]|nr:hypothetical protein F4859DRAFT_466007 [Xylaria cf. heliscus]
MSTLIMGLSIWPTTTALVVYAIAVVWSFIYRSPIRRPALPNPPQRPASPTRSSGTGSETSSETGFTEEANDVLDQLNDQFLPTIANIIQERDRAESEGRPYPDAWRHLGRPANLPPPDEVIPNDQPDDEFRPIVERQRIRDSLTPDSTLPRFTDSPSYR